MIPQKDAIKFIVALREIQEIKHKGDKHTVPEWIIITRRQLQKAEDLWYNGDATLTLQRLGHVAACGLAAVEQCAEGKSQND